MLLTEKSDDAVLGSCTQRKVVYLQRGDCLTAVLVAGFWLLPGLWMCKLEGKGSCLLPRPNSLHLDDALPREATSLLSPSMFREKRVL